MPDDVLRRAVAMALRQRTGWLSVTLFGGEPLLAAGRLPQIEQIVREEVRATGTAVPVRWLLDTNSTLLGASALAWLSPPRDTRVFVSVDGTAAAHDRFRIDAQGGPTHARVVDGLAKLRERKIPFEIQAVVTPDTSALLADSLRFLLGLGAAKISIAADLRARWPETAITELREGVRAAARVWADEFRGGRGVIVEPFHGKVLSHLLGQPPCAARCQVATRELAVAPSGRVFPCAPMVGEDRSERFVLGDVDRGLDPRRVDALRALSTRIEVGCAECGLRARCSYRCACRQWASSGEVGRAGRSLCDTEECWVDAADAAAEELHAEGCASFLALYYGQRWAAVHATTLQKAGAGVQAFSGGGSSLGTPPKADL